MNIVKIYQRLRGHASQSASHSRAVNTRQMPPLTPLGAADMMDDTIDGSNDDWATRLNDGFAMNWNEEAA